MFLFWFFLFFFRDNQPSLLHTIQYCVAKKANMHVDVMSHLFYVTCIHMHITQFAIEVSRNRISCPNNWSKQILETHTACSAGDTQYVRQSLNEKPHGFTDNYLLSVKPCKDLQKTNLDTYFFTYKIKTDYFKTKQVLWTFRKSFFLQFDTNFASKQQRLAKIGTILWLLLSTQILQVWLATGKIRWRKGQYYQAHIPRSWPVSTTARFATKGGLIQIQTDMYWWRKWMENHF